jgi:hypothetical protein
VYSILELVIQDSELMWKIIPITFRESAHAWYNNLESSSIKGFNDLCLKLVASFSTNIPTKKSSIELFSVTQQEDKPTLAYLKSFNEQMLKVE